MLDPIQIKVRFDEYLNKTKRFSLLDFKDVDEARRVREYRERALRINRGGHMVPAYVVQAFDDLWRVGPHNHFALVLFTFDASRMYDREFMMGIVRKLQSLRNTVPAEPDLVAAAALMADSRAVFDRRRQVPPSLTGGVPVYLGELFVQRDRLARGYLSTDQLMCVAQPELGGGIELLPSWLVEGKPDPHVSGGSWFTRPAFFLAVVLVITLTFGALQIAGLISAKGHRKVVVKSSHEIESGITWHEVELPGGDGSRTLWIYIPNAPASKKLPCVFIAPAGTPCITGGELGPFYDKDGISVEEHEHIPYARAGYAVVAYSLDGNVPDEDQNTFRGVIPAIRAFRDAHCGVDDEKSAVDYVLKNLPQIDSTRLYTAGHSSAAVVALLAAENDPRIAGCIAYAPACDIASRMDQDTIDGIEAHGISDFDQFLTECSPATKASSLRCPVFLFHADDDSNVPTSDIAKLLKALAATNTRVSYSTTPTGDHYQSMIDVGIPRGIDWLKAGMPTLTASTPSGAADPIAAESPTYVASPPTSGPVYVPATPHPSMYEPRSPYVGSPYGPRSPDPFTYGRPRPNPYVRPRTISPPEPVGPNQWPSSEQRPVNAPSTDAPADNSGYNQQPSTDPSSDPQQNNAPPADYGSGGADYQQQ